MCGASARSVAFYRVFHRVEPVDGSRIAAKVRRGFLLHAGQDVLVGRHREPGCRVSEAFAHDLDRDAGFEEQGGVGVAEVVEPDAGSAERATSFLNASETTCGWMGVPSSWQNT